MRLIGELSEQGQAKLIVAHLVTKGIATSVELEDGKWELWVKEEDRVDEASTELELFLENPSHERYRGVLEKAVALEKEQEEKRRQIQKNLIKVQHRNPNQRRMPLTILLTVICGIVALATSFCEKGTGFEESTVYQTLIGMFISGPEVAQLQEQFAGNKDSLQFKFASVAKGEIWRLVTPIFIHYGVFHLVFNMWWLISLGGILETKYGTFYFGLLVLVSAAISSAAQIAAPVWLDGSSIYIAGATASVDGGGMSGVIYALFGFVWMKSTYDRSSGFRIPNSTVIIMLGWLFFCMTPFEEQLLNSRVANWAHGVGLIVGMIAGLLPSRSR